MTGDKQLKPWVQGDPPSAAHWNEAVNRLNEIGQIVGVGDLQVQSGPNGTSISLNQRRSFAEEFIGYVVEPVDDSDHVPFTDNRYWIKRVNNLQTAGMDIQSAFNQVDDAITHVGMGTLYCVTNIKETSTHTLSENTLVRVYSVTDQLFDSVSVPIKYYVINEVSGLNCDFSSTTSLPGGVTGSDDSTTWAYQADANATLTVCTGAYFDTATGILSITTRTVTIGSCGLIKAISAGGRTTVDTAATCS